MKNTQRGFDGHNEIQIMLAVEWLIEVGVHFPWV